MDFHHVYNRGANKEIVFKDDTDRQRFVSLLYLCNSTTALLFREVEKRRYRGRTSVSYFQEERKDVLVHIVAYALMPNHFHLIIGSEDPVNLSKFIQKFSTAYTMYFNKRHDHSGVVFQGKAKRKVVDSEEYFRWLFAYVHLNPIDLIFPGWEEKGIDDSGKVRVFIHEYPWSSYRDIHVGKRDETALLSLDQMPDFLMEIDDLEDLLTSFKNTEVGPRYFLKDIFLGTSGESS